MTQPSDTRAHAHADTQSDAHADASPPTHRRSDAVGAAGADEAAGAGPAAGSSVARRWPLVLGAVLGLGLALHGLLATDGRAAESLGDGVVATVNGRPIRQIDLDRALAAVAADRHQRPVDAAERRRVLDRLIDNELLVQRGIELGLLEQDRRVRADLSAAVIDLLVARGQQQVEPSDAVLRAYYRANAGMFRSPPALKLRRLFVRIAAPARAGEARERARRAADRWRHGQSVTELTDDPPLVLPRGRLPVSKLRDYLGPRLVQAALALEVGEVSEPVRARGGYHLLEVLERRDGAARPFAEVRAQVLAAWRRAQGDQRLRSFLAARRRTAQVRVAEGAP